jgi:hypothetical protein
MKSSKMTWLLARVTVLAIAYCAASRNTNLYAQSAGTSAHGQQAQPAQSPVRAKITYSIRAGASSFDPVALVATFNGKTSVLIPKSENKCLVIVERKDFDGDGLADALVENETACGGNCCANTFFFVSARPDGSFTMSDEFADSWADPTIEKWKDRWSVVVVSNNAGVNRERPVEMTRRFVLEAGKAVKVEEHQRKNMKAVVEMRSEIFRSDKPDETHTLQYDLDGDGKKDTITGTLWERWGSILWKVEFADGKKFSSSTGCKRIGVLATKTAGVHDLVCDQDTVLHWDGSAYK